MSGAARRHRRARAGPYCRRRPARSRGSGSRRAFPRTHRPGRRRAESPRACGARGPRPPSGADRPSRRWRTRSGSARPAAGCLDHRGHLLVDRIPVDDLKVHLDAGLLRVRLGEGLPERACVVLAVVGDDNLDRGYGAAPGAASLVAAGGEERRNRTHPPGESETSHRLRLLAMTTVTQPPGGPKPFVTSPCYPPVEPSAWCRPSTLLIARPLSGTGSRTIPYA